MLPRVLVPDPFNATILSHSSPDIGTGSLPLALDLGSNVDLSQ